MSRDDVSFRISYPLGFLGRTAALCALSCGVGLAILRWIFSWEFGADFASAFYAVRNLLRFLVPALVFSALGVLLVASLSVFAVTLPASHKIAGPLFRLQRVAGRLGRRTLVGAIHLRASDQGKPVATAMNGWVKLRKGRLALLRSQSEAVATALRACEDALAAGDSNRFSASLSALRHHARELERSNT
jgi:hypothetical protein